jgi:glycosyltransferase involved in cell wall biosynthesis
MKILNLHTAPNGLFSKFGNPNGGLEKGLYDFHVLLVDFGVDVNTVCSPNDWCASEVGFLPINPKSDWRVHWKHYCSCLHSLIKKEKPEVIIVHGTNKLLKVFNEWEIPVLFLDHQGHGSINWLYHFDFYTNVVPKNRSFGGKIYGVSELSNSLKEGEISKQKIDENFMFDGALKYLYITKEIESYSVSGHNFNAVTIGNPEGYKQPHKIDFLRKKGFVSDYSLITQKPEIPKAKINKYWEKYIESNLEISSRTKCNISRKETFDILNKSMIYASTSPYESAGLTTLEAFSMGVPAILWANKEQHASTMFAPDGKGWIWEYISSTNLNEFVEQSKTVDRNKIRDYVFEINNKKVIFEKVINELETCFENKTKYESTTLEDFF